MYCYYCGNKITVPSSIREYYCYEPSYMETQKRLQENIENKRQGEVKRMQENIKQYACEDNKNQSHILHISDLHIRTEREATIYVAQLKTDLVENLKVKRLNYLIISGDIVEYARVEEYEAAYMFVDSIVREFELDLNRVIIVPGNHDLSWDASRRAHNLVYYDEITTSPPKGCFSADGDIGYLKPDEELYKKRFANFNESFYKKIYKLEYPLEYDQQVRLHCFDEDKILVCALNSAWEIDHQNKIRASINIKALSKASLDILKEAEKYRDWVKIAVWHHAITGENAMNSDFMEQLATLGFEVCLHGHVHEAKKGLYEYDAMRKIHIVGAGTFGARPKDQVTSIPLQYNLLRYNKDEYKFKVETRKKERVDGAWCADARWKDKNQPIPYYECNLMRHQGNVFLESFPMVLWVHGWQEQQYADKANKVLDWKGHFDIKAMPRRIPKPDIWKKKLLADLQIAVDEWNRNKVAFGNRIRLYARLCLSGGVMIGNQFSRPTGGILEIEHYGQIWRSDEIDDTYAPIGVSHIGNSSVSNKGIVILNVTADITADVKAYLNISQPSTDYKLIHTITPADGAGQSSIKTNGQAVKFALEVKNEVVKLRSGGVSEVWLFLNTPLSVAAFVGHYLTAVPTIQLFEFNNSEYVPTCRI